MNKIIFLDCDGVINYYKWYISDKYQKGEYNDPDIDPIVIDRLNSLCVVTGAKIVISSSWKINPYCFQRLRNAGLHNIIDKTPDFVFSGNQDYCRGWEILGWLGKNPVDDYIIIDDCWDFYEYQREHFIKIDPMYGFTEDDYKIAKTMLNNEINK